MIMKTIPFLSIFCGLCIAVHAQNSKSLSADTVDQISVQNAINEFNRLKQDAQKKANEVTDTITPISDPIGEVRVEPIRKGTGKIDPDLVKLKVAFPAKPLTKNPENWVVEKSDDAPAFTRDVELQPGTIISLNIQPHVLSPIADGQNAFSVSEFGYDPLAGQRQRETVSAILGKSIAQLDEDSEKLGKAISELRSLLDSFPKPQPASSEGRSHESEDTETDLPGVLPPRALPVIPSDQ